MRPKHKKLPNKLSALIRIAVKDLELAEQSPNVEINMSQWHTVDRYSKKCMVCFAGGVIRGFMEDTDDRYEWDLIPTKYHDRLMSLNEVRHGNIPLALREMGITQYDKNKVRRRKVVTYHENPTKFKKQMLSIADVLERNGL